MKSETTTNDLERLVRGESISKESFLAILGDPAAMRELARLKLVRDLFRPSSDEPDDATSVAELPFTLEDLTMFYEHRLEDSKRRDAVRSYLTEHFPDMLPESLSGFRSADTELADTCDTATQLAPETENKSDRKIP